MRFMPTGPSVVGSRDLAFSTLSPWDRLDAAKHCVGRIFYPAAPSPFSTPVPWVPSWIRASGDLNLVTCPLECCIRGRPKPIAHNPVLSWNWRQRNTYSCICCELASQGFLVVSLEHADGTASLAQLASPATWPSSKIETPSQCHGRYRWYGGLGDTESQTEKTHYRVQELRTTLGLLRDLNEGTSVKGLSISGDIASFPLKGRLDLSRVAVIGHSYGGATVAAASSELEAFKCSVCLDPWWGALPEDCAALSGWKTVSPCLIIGSHAWNRPDGFGKMACGAERQEQLLRAAAKGPGALLAVPRDTNHHSFDDIDLLYGSLLKVILKTLFHGMGQGMPADRAQALNCKSILRFLEDHLLLDQLGESGIGGRSPLQHPPPLTRDHIETYTDILGADAEVVRMGSIN